MAQGHPQEHVKVMDHVTVIPQKKKRVEDYISVQVCRFHDYNFP
jgi:hypothetical protein